MMSLETMKKNEYLDMNHIYNIDCMIGLKMVRDKSVDMILCDLPYGTTNCKWDIALNLEELWEEYKRIIKDNGAILLFAQCPFDKILGSSNLEMLRYEWIWEKTTATGHLNVKKMPMKAHENILVFYKNPPTYNPQKTYGHSPTHKFTKYIDTQNNTDIYHGFNKEVNGGGNTDRYPRSVLKFPKDPRKDYIHPTQKPLELCRYLIRTYTNKDDLVLDNCCGSGTTCLAAKIEERHYIGMDNGQNKEGRLWAEIATERMDSYFSETI